MFYRDIFSLGFGPFRWVCTSGDPDDLSKSDAIADKVLRGIIAGIECGGAEKLPHLNLPIPYFE